MPAYAIEGLCSTVNFSHAEEKKEFEKHFYRAFNKLKEQKFIRSIWNWDDEQQTISFKIPEEHITIFTYKNEVEQNVMYSGGLYDRKYCQFDKFGFKPPVTNDKYMEILTLFSTHHFNKNLYNIQKVFINEYCVEQAREQGCKFILATCTPLLLKLYLKWGFKVIETRELDGAIRHLIQLDL
ncbi:MAG: hypothetical protein J7604_16120 [Sporocytophaga sp.]|uniref:hypothetical protein n=1 Tax=Sporocytophaga sp. TaxID=2231183 RepID=UPI001B1D471E|nr:hypothetical protein [Sporocytophaga sp.]MBO9701733.1 hypothetical protein [Sporocytophaga sp.]